MFSSLTILIFRLLKKTNILKCLTLSTPIVLNNRKIIIPLQRSIGYPNLFIKEDFLFELMRLFLPEKPGVFIDVGVNIGQTLIKVKTIDKNRQYIGFEPNRICADYTSDLIHLNSYTNCEVRTYALSDKSKVVKLAHNEATDASASIVENLRPNYFKDSIFIDCIAFDESGITEPIAILKIDVEGAELEVLMGMQQTIATFQPLIVCEVLDGYSAEVLAFTQHRADSLCRLLHEHKYIIFQLHQNKKRIDSFDRVDSIVIKSWTTESYNLNDYLFCHVTFEKKMMELLNRLSSV